MNFSKRICGMQASPIRKLVPYAEEAKKSGKKVYHLNIGQPDIKTPVSFFEAVSNFKEDVLAYSTSQGSPELINAIVEYYKTYDIHFDFEDVLITNGGSEALLFAMIATCDPGENIVVPEPFYTNYQGFAEAVNVEVKGITTTAEEGFHLPSDDAIEKVINEKTRAIILSNPGNPTGVVYTKEELQRIAKIAIKHNLFIISDEVYREFVYDGLEYTSFGNLKEVEDRVMIVDSVSKDIVLVGQELVL